MNIEEQIEKYIADREKFLLEVNRQLAWYNGAIAALETLIAKPAEDAPETDTENNDKAAEA